MICFCPKMLLLLKKTKDNKRDSQGITITEPKIKVTKKKKKEDKKKGAGITKIR